MNVRSAAVIAAILMSACLLYAPYEWDVNMVEESRMPDGLARSIAESRFLAEKVERVRQTYPLRERNFPWQQPFRQVSVGYGGNGRGTGNVPMNVVVYRRLLLAQLVMELLLALGVSCLLAYLWESRHRILKWRSSLSAAPRYNKFAVFILALPQNPQAVESVSDILKSNVRMQSAPLSKSVVFRQISTMADRYATPEVEQACYETFLERLKAKKPQESEARYVICPACKFEQWDGYSACQKCGRQFTA